MKGNSSRKISFATLIVVLLIISNICAYATDYWGSWASYTAGDYSATHASYMNVTST